MTAVLAAYSLLLHVLVMAAIAGPKLDAETSLVAQLQIICSGKATARSDLPAPASQNQVSPPCALCGLGHSAVDLPNIALVPVPASIIETIARVPQAPIPAGALRIALPIQPRAPPVFS